MSYFVFFRLYRGVLHKVFPLVCNTVPLRVLSSGPPRSRSLRESYRLLQLPEDGGNSSRAEVKEAYLRMAKLYHPDCGAPTADAALFSLIEEAYRVVLAHLTRQESMLQATKDEEEEEKGKTPALQHRHYLTFEGVGSGTPSQRKRQYQQVRVDRANDQVLEYRYKQMEMASVEEGSLVSRDARLRSKKIKITQAMEMASVEEGSLVSRDARLRSKKIKITQAMERLVEDLIQESMARGDFRNLSGTGKPLNKFDHNPYADPMTHNLNRILIDNGYQPEWIVVQKEIRETIKKMRERLQEVRARLGNPMRHSEQLQWKEHCAAFADELLKLNKKVDNFNLIVPLMSWQMVHFNMNREVEKVLKADHEHRKEKERAAEKMPMQERDKAATSQQGTRRGLLVWVQSLLK